jgi:uncharacterized protein YkwD
VISIATILVPGPAVERQAEVRLHAIEARLVDVTNAERARYGLGPLAIDAGLIRSARAQAMRMTRLRRLEHTRISVAENIAAGQSTCGQVVGDWMKSPGHRANILNGRHTRIGTAAYVTPEGTVYWCQQFLP